MAVLLYGTALYNGSAPMPFGIGQGRDKARPSTPRSLQSPSLGRSPLLHRRALDADAKAPELRRVVVEIPKFSK